MSEALIIFARYPRIGCVKTRLQSTLGSQGCLRLHDALLTDTVLRTQRIARPLFLYLGDCTAEEASDLAARKDWNHLDLRLQRGEDMGQRMWKAVEEVRRRHLNIVILGSDSPSLPLERISLAFQSLKRRPVVVGPAEDGGYYLLGLATPKREIFQGIDWGSPLVLRQTLASLDDSEYSLLPPWYDVDGALDLQRLAQDLRRPFEGFPHHTKVVLESLPAGQQLDMTPKKKLRDR